MSYREIPAQFVMGMAETFAKSLGCEPEVTLSEHSIDIDYTVPDKDRKAWDSSMYKNGNVFVEGYANPIKPRVHDNPELENPDTVDVVEGDGGVEVEEREGDSSVDGAADREDGAGGERDKHVGLISSSRYQTYMQQDLVSQLLTPQEQWRLIAYGILALGGLSFMNIIIVLYATGSF